MLAGGVALHATNVYVATTVLPSVVQEIGGLHLFAWNTTLFVLASIVGSALAAATAARVGARSAYVLAALAFAAGSALAASAQDMHAMLLGRTIQGFGGGLLVAMAYALISTLLPQALWPRAMALVSGMWGVATLAGPAIGGIFAELGSWRSAFWTSVVLAALLLAAAWRLLGGNARSAGAEPIALPQIACLAAAVLLLSQASVQGSALARLAFVALSLGALGALVLLERRSATKLLPAGTFASRSTLGRLLAAMALLAAVVTGTEIYVPLFVQLIHGRTPLVAGYLAALMAAGWTAGSVLFAGAAPRQLLAAGPVLAVVGTVAAMVSLPFGWPMPRLQLVAISASLVLTGAGVGICWPHLLTAILRSAAPGEESRASGAITTVQLVATALAAALAGLVVNTAGLGSSAASASAAALWLFGTFAVVGAGAVVCARGGSR
jgi:MFS family permease